MPHLPHSTQRAGNGTTTGHTGTPDYIDLDELADLILADLELAAVEIDPASHDADAGAHLTITIHEAAGT